ncbi:MAG: DUF2795 domain-containing protein [Actinomycetota bacterium]|nr:DUF2795 domain-containing protein [Actinomycetota bacterium]
MERESTKHGRRLDEQLRHETASIVQGAPVIANSREDLRQEDPDEGLDVEAGTRPEVPERLEVTEREAERRADLARAVAGAHFPATRAELLRAAGATDANEAVLAELGALAPEVHFANVQAVWDHLGGHREQRDHHAHR